MATARLVPSSYGRSSTSRVTVTNPDNMYMNTDDTSSYCTLRGRNQNSSTAYYVFISGFNFSSIPSNATVSAFTVKIRCYRSSNQRTGSNYYLRLCSSASSSSVISGTTTSTNIGTSQSVITIPTGNLTWSTLSGYGSNFCIEVPLSSNSSSYPYVYVYGAEIEVTYTAGNVAVTGVTLDKNTASIDIGDTTQLTATIAPSNATNQNVTWSTSNSSIATVSSTGLVTGVAAGTATITVTTADGNKTASCTVTVTQPTYVTYKLASSMEPGKSYLIANGNSGSVYLLSNESGGSRLLKGVAATVSSNKIQITTGVASKTLFDCVQYTSGNDVTITISNGGKYLYSDNRTGLRLQTTSSLDRFWHWEPSTAKFWQFKSTSSNGYTDTSSEYKYYLTLSGTNFTDSHLTSPSIEDTNIPEIYFFEEDTGATDELYIKVSGSWVKATKVYKKVSGSWVEQTDLTNVFDSGTNYKVGS